MRVLTGIIAIMLPLFVVAQSKKADITVRDLVIRGQQYILDCGVHFNNESPEKAGRYIIFFISSGSRRLYQVKVKGDRYLQDHFPVGRNSDDYKIHLEPQRLFRQSNFTLYTILVEGNNYKLPGSLKLIDGEFEEIKDVLGMLYKTEQIPAAYTVTER